MTLELWHHEILFWSYHFALKHFLNITVNCIKVYLKFELYYRRILKILHATMVHLKVVVLEENVSTEQLKARTKKDFILHLNLYWYQRTCNLFGEYSQGFKIEPCPVYL